MNAFTTTSAPEAPRPTAGHRDDIELLRFATAGSVDDGKSTLIGRLLYDAKALFDDQLEDLSRHADLARVTDGLRAEREQGITIDVAYRYFSTEARRFVIADCPGHRQYTRNAVTGFSQSDVAVLLVDARHGVVEQTRRHALLATRFGSRRLVFCVNKMDLVDFVEPAFRRIEAQLSLLADRLGLPPEAVDVLPVSALEGDQITSRSSRLDWFEGPSLLERLETLPVRTEPTATAGRMAVQLTLRPDGDAAGRRYAGKVVSGQLAVGDEVTVLPSGQRSTVVSLETFEGPLAVARAPRDISVRLADQVDVGRGDVLAVGEPPPLLRRREAIVAWMSEQTVTAPRALALKHLSRRTKCRLRSIEHHIELDTFAPRALERPTLGLNDVARVQLDLAQPIPIEGQGGAHPLARFILIDPQTQDTVAAGYFV